MSAKYFLLIIPAVIVVLFFANIIVHPGLRLGTTSSSPKRPNWPDQPFTIGPPADYAKPGVYFDFAKSHGVYVVSHRGMIVALSVDDPFNHRPTRYDKTIKQYVEPHAQHRFTTNGLITGVASHVRRMLDDRKAIKKALEEKKPIARSLERCYIKLQDDEEGELSVDPRHRFIQELNQWSRQYSGYLFDQE